MSRALYMWREQKMHTIRILARPKPSHPSPDLDLRTPAGRPLPY